MHVGSNIRPYQPDVRPYQPQNQPQMTWVGYAAMASVYSAIFFPVVYKAVCINPDESSDCALNYRSVVRISLLVGIALTVSFLALARTEMNPNGPLQLVR